MYDPLLHYPLRLRTASTPTLDSDDAFDPFQFRFHANIHRIHQLFFRLYGGRQDCESQFWGLVDDLIHSFEARPQVLKAVDLEREADPNWLMSEKWMGMMLYVDRFVGKLQDFEEKIPYLSELGVNWIHLMPLLKSPPGSNDGGYAVSDYRAVDARFGTLEDLNNTTTALRKAGMLSTLDLVMNHTSDQHEWALKARSGDPDFRDFYYFFPNRDLPDQFEHTLPEIFPHSSPGNFTYVPERTEWVMSVFHNYQWDLNYTNPKVFREMLKVLLFLGNQGVDILRLDAVAFTWKRLGTTSQNLPEAHTILQLMKACAQVVAPGLAFIAEAIVAPHEVIKYFGEGDAWGRECEVAYHATFMALIWDALATQQTHLLQKGLISIPGKPARTTWINYLRCHDDIGLGFDEHHLRDLGKDPYAHKSFLVDYYSGNFPESTATGAPFAANPKTGDARISGSLAALTGLEDALRKQDQRAIDLALQKSLMMHSIIFAYGGLPLLYYGDEVATTNNYDYLNDPDQAYDNRWMHRPIIHWDKVEKRTEQGSVENRMFQGLRKLIFLRKASPEFADLNSSAVQDPGNGHLFAFLRWNGEGARTMVVANFSESAQQIGPEVFWRCGMDPYQLIDKISAGAPEVDRGKLIIQPFTCFWLTEPPTFKAFQEAQELKQLKKEGVWREKAE